MFSGCLIWVCFFSFDTFVPAFTMMQINLYFVGFFDHLNQNSKPQYVYCYIANAYLHSHDTLRSKKINMFVLNILIPPPFLNDTNSFGFWFEHCRQCKVPD